MQLDSTLDIAAPIDAVWHLTTDVTAWPTLTPTTVQRVERLDDGPMRVGSAAKVKQPMQRATTWTVTRYEPNEWFVWEATTFGVHLVATHHLEPIDLADGAGTGCRNTLTIEMSGRGAGLMARLAGRRIRETIETENEQFRRHAQERAGTSAPR